MTPAAPVALARTPRKSFANDDDTGRYRVQPAGLTRPQRKILEFVRAYILEHGVSPTYEEIRIGVGAKSKSIVYRHVHALADRGALIFVIGLRRSIRPVPASPVLSIELPPHLFANVQDLAAKAKVTPEAVVIEAVRDGFAALRSKSVPHETSRATAAPPA